MDTFFIFLLCLALGAAKIRIKHLDVPSSIKSGEVDEVILDCDFEAEGESGIEVKWFLNGLIEQIYQWIPETNKRGQAIGRLKDNIDVNYNVSSDRNTMYRALRITNITPELSGNYSCKVSGDNTEDVVTKSMIIYDPADDGLDLGIYESDSAIYCKASGLYPEPQMKIFIAKDNETDIIFEEDEEIIEFEDISDSETDTYNVSATLFFPSENLTGNFFYGCELEIPGTSYRLFEIKSHFLETGEIETQIEEDYVSLLNSTNNNNSTGSFDDLSQESGSLRQLPSISSVVIFILLSTAIL